MKSLKLTWDDDQYSPFYRSSDLDEGMYICLSQLNPHFDPPIPGFDDEEGESDETLPDHIWICTAATLPDRAWYGGFKLTPGEPYVDAYLDGDSYWNPAGHLNHLVKMYLRDCYSEGARWVWIEYEEK